VTKHRRYTKKKKKKKKKKNDKEHAPPAPVDRRAAHFGVFLGERHLAVEQKPHRALKHLQRVRWEPVQIRHLWLL
jgi:hypothetical protein